MILIVLNNIEICDDGIDNDGDGKADILDTDCPQNQVEICSDRRDNDGDGLIDTNDPDCLAGESQIDDSETANSSQRQEAIFIDEDGLVQDITLKAVLFQSEEIIPNANGFTANYVVKIINEGKSVNNLNVIGVLPSMLSYNSHVSTEESVAYDRNTNSILIPSLGRGDVVEIYFNVDITSNVCAQLNNVVSVQAYTLLVQLDLCDEYEEVQSKVYQTRLLEEAVAEGTSSLKASPSTGGGSFGISVSMCADNIDNDGDGLVDKNDQDCYDTNGTSEFGQNECSDKIDNDEDGKIDLDDLECLYSQGVSETDPNLSECADGIDNDGDGKIDYVDRECTTTEGEAEALYGDTECSDGIDNDGDKNIDLEDRDCVDENDDAESVKQCSDGIDNDDDKNIDLNDPECYKDPEDNNESS
jgi:hypothetical protein